MNANLPQLDLPRDYVVGNDITEAILKLLQADLPVKSRYFRVMR